MNLEINSNSVDLKKNEGSKGNCREGVHKDGKEAGVVFQDGRKLEGKKKTRGDGIIVVKSFYKYMKLSNLLKF